MHEQRILGMVISYAISLSLELKLTSEAYMSRTARADHEIYYSQLLTKKRGYPLWVPGVGRQLPIEYRQGGISIGDVGIFTLTGEFDFLFNIFHPASHPINRGVVPRGFSHLSLEELVSDIQENTVYGPDSYLASSSVRKISMNWIGQVLFHRVILDFSLIFKCQRNIY
jgi:hypothetical protein